MKNIFNKLFVFDMANNHQGSPDHGLRIIKEISKISRTYGINAAVKFQYRNLDTFIHKDFIHNNGSNGHIQRFLSTRLNPNDFFTMVQAAKEEGLITACTPFDEDSVGLLLDHGIEIIKVGSCSANDWPLLEKISQARKPVICSTGGLSLSKIDDVFSFFTHRDVNFALLHCVGLYPTPGRNVQADFIDKLIRRFPGIAIGYSGHENPEDTDIIKIAIAKGAKIFEKHVGIETGQIKLNAYSLSPSQAENWVKSALKAFEICGDSEDKKITQGEIDSIRSLMRGAYAKKGIKSGQELKKDAVYFAMPCVDSQTSASEYLDTMTASRDYKADEAIKEKRVFSKIFLLREVIHDVKGMLHEANISAGKEFSIEVSHHYGIQHVRQFGAALVNVINRQYCKKLVLMLPGQQHPAHCHKIKEETFQLLWGDIEIVVNGNKRVYLKPGETLLIEPGTMHSFNSAVGAILEEISTTYTREDSVYEDEEINRKDPMERKTILESW